MFWNDLSQDFRYGARLLRKNPAFAAVGVLTLALGLGANAAIFSLVDAVLLKPLPYPEPDRLVMVFEKPPNGSRNSIAAANFLDWREQSKTVALVASNGTWLTWTGHGEPRKVQARTVSYDYFDVLGSPVSTGRGFLPQEGQPGNEHVMVISHRFWEQQLAGDPNVLGTSLTLDGSLYKIVGTLPAGSWYDRHTADVWMPLPMTHAGSSREFHTYQAYGRLRPGATLASARAELNGIAARIAQDYPATNKGWGVMLDLLSDRVVSATLRQTLRVLFAAVAAVLLIACVNLANLLLARSAGRERELWVRLSLGAGRGRLVQQFLAESLLLSLAGALAGWGVGYGLLKALTAWMPPFTLPTQSNPQMDWRVLGYLAGVAVVCGLLFGAAPAVAAWRRDAAEGLREGVRGSSGGVSGRRTRATLIVIEVALSFTLVATAGVLIHSFIRLTGVDTGVEMDNVVTLMLPRAMNKNIDSVREVAVMTRVRDAVAALPGIRDAALTTSMPLQGVGFGMPFQIQGPSKLDHQEGIGFKIISPAYFHALGMKITAGRGLEAADRAGMPPALVINQTAARRYFATASPIGQHMLIQQIVTGKFQLGPTIPWEVVGVVADEQTRSLDSPLSPVAYVTFDQSPVVGVGLVVRGQSNPLAMMKAVRSAIWEVNPDQAITDVKPLLQILTESSAGNRFSMMILAGFAMLALVLAAVGIYGVVAYTVSQRTREMGIRAALGASRTALLGLAARESMALTAVGLAAGVGGIYWSSGLVASLLFQTKPVELQTMAIVAGVLGLVAVLASLIPARRAARVDPAVALRHE